MYVTELDSIYLIKRCAADTHDAIAWQELFAHFSPKIKIYLARNCRQARHQSPYLASQTALIPAQELEDLTQEVWLRVIDKDCWLLKCFRGETEEASCAFFAVLAGFVARDHYRNLRRKKRPLIECSLDRLPDAGCDRWPVVLTGAQTDNALEEHFFRKEVIASLYRTVQTLYSAPRDSATARLIFDLHFFQGFTADEISRCTDIALSRPSVARVISTLRRELKHAVKAFDRSFAQTPAPGNRASTPPKKPLAEKKMKKFKNFAGFVRKIWVIWLIYN